MHRTKSVAGGRQAEAAERARALARRGNSAGALAVALAGEALETAAEILEGEGRFGEAARVLLLEVGAGLAALRRLDQEGQEPVLAAAALLERAGEAGLGVDLLRAVGAHERAHAMAEAAHLPFPAVSAEEQERRRLELCREVARFAYEELGRPEDAGRILEAVGRFGESALIFFNVGDRARAQTALLRVGHDDPLYRAACVRVVALASDLGELGIVTEQFLSDFVRGGPLSAVELESFARLAQLYETHGLLGNAEEVLTKLLAVRPDLPAEREALTRVQAARRAASAGKTAILAEEAAFHRRARRVRPSVGQVETPAVTQTSPTTPPMPFVEGALIADRYRLGPMIGRGGMAVVFEAHDVELGGLVALKVFVHPVEGDELKRRFKLEMQVSRQLQHVNILRLHDIGLHEGYRFVSMERLVGADLRKLLPSKPSVAVAVSYLKQAAAGLAAAHEQGVIHRDVKPENLFVTDAALVKVMDFGIAKVMSAPNVTLGGVIWGTPRYMSPEQINSFSSVTAASDLYSLGVVAYEMVVGHPPFDHPDLSELLLMHLRQTPLAPRELKPDLPVELERLIVELLAKNQAHRPKTALECCERLAALKL